MGKSSSLAAHYSGEVVSDSLVDKNGGSLKETWWCIGGASGFFRLLFAGN